MNSMAIVEDIAERELPVELAGLLGVERSVLLEYGALCFQLGLRLGKSGRLARFEQDGEGYRVDFDDACRLCEFGLRLIGRGSKGNGASQGGP